MRSNVEWKRCPCGNLTGLRESCVRCASAARARLHEAGIARDEGVHYRPIDVAKLADGWAWPDEQAERLREHFCKHVPPAVGDRVSWAVAERDMRERPEARYEHAAANGARTYRLDGGQLKSIGIGYDCDASFSGGYEHTGTWVRLEDASGTTVPAVGAEVSWSEAKADMMRRKEARYRPGHDRDVSYAWSGSWVRKVDGDLWVTDRLGEAVLSMLLWVRLA